MKRTSIFILIICLALAVQVFFSPAVAADDSAREQMLKRLMTGEMASASLFAPLTNLLLDYAETIIPKTKLGELYGSQGRADFLGRLKVLTGKDILDFGNDMFRFYEERPPGATGDPWINFTAGPFLLYIRPGSAADKDRDLISRDAADTSARIAAALDLASAFETARRLLVPAAGSAPDVIPVYLHASRQGEASQRLRKQSYGSTTLGATIVDRAGRLTCRIDVFYLNALSLAVLEHEVAHAVILLASFDTALLVARELGGEAELRKAFFAGYRQIPSILQEGLGDWAFYYHGFHKNWGLLPPPEDMVKELRSEAKTLPLKELLGRGVTFRDPKYKVYSLEAASFLEYIVRTRGRDVVRRWLFSGQTDGAKTFASIFGFSIEDAEKEWLAQERK
jgi:hypothetical protein